MTEDRALGVLVSRLQLLSPDVFREVAPQILSRGDEAVEHLQRLLQGGDKLAGSRVLDLLGRIGTLSAARTLKAFVDSPPAPLREKRAVALRLLQTLQVGEQLDLGPWCAQLARDKDPFVRAAAIDLAVKLRVSEVQDIIKQGLRDADPFVLQCAQKAVGTAAGGAVTTSGRELTQAVLDELLDPDPTRRTKGLRQLEADRDAAQQALMHWLTAGTERNRIRSAYALGLLKERRALGALLQMAQGEGEIASSALQALALMAGPDTPRLRQLFWHRLSHHYHFVRLYAIEGLLRCGDEAGLLRGLEDHEPFVLDKVLELAAKGPIIQKEGAAQAIVQLLADVKDRRRHLSEGIVAKALFALSRLSPEALPPGAGALETVFAFCQSDNVFVAEAAAELVSALVSREDHRLFEPLLELLNHTSEVVRVAALAALQVIVTPEDIAAVPLIVPHSRSADGKVARRALAALSQIASQDALEAVLDMAHSHSQEQLRSYARELVEDKQLGAFQVVSDASGRLQLELVHRCTCNGALRYVLTRSGRDELRCSSCNREYVMLPNGLAVGADQVPHGACACPQCRRKQALKRDQHSELYCPMSGERYVTDPDTNGRLMVRNLPHGICSCCIPTAPLKVGPQGLWCPRSRTPYENVDGTFRPVRRQPAAASVDAINEALIRGSLVVYQSGVVGPNDDEE